jgi:RimJ/RimL family protein N-acetyltransferase
VLRRHEVAATTGDPSIAERSAADAGAAVAALAAARDDDRVIVLETPRLRLRHFVPDDDAYVIEQVNDPLWRKFIGHRDVRTKDEARAYLARGPLAMYERHGFGLWAAETRVSNTVIGMCGLIRRDGLDDVDIGFALLPAYRGQGYAFEAAAATLRHGHAVCGLARIVAITSPDNQRSAALLTAIGMRREGTVHLAEHAEPSLLFASEA